MVSKLGYDSYVKRLNSATVAAILLGGSISVLVPAASAQINGTPASVTSINSGGHFNSSGSSRQHHLDWTEWHST